MRYFVQNKPPGCITARTDFAGRPTVYAHVPPHYPELPHVGRLDFNTEGLLLFTDDGRLAQALLNPGWAGRSDPAAVAPVEKVYHVKVRGVLAPGDPRLSLMTEPIVVPGAGTTSPAEVRPLAPRARATWIEVVITEGKNHQVRRLCARSGLQVVKLRRVRLGPISLGELALRWCRPLSTSEVAACYAQALPGEPVPAVEPIDDSREAYERARAAAGRTRAAPGAAAVSAIEPGGADDAELDEEE